MLFAILAVFAVGMVAALRPEIHPEISHIEINMTRTVACQVPTPLGQPQPTMHFKYNGRKLLNPPPGITLDRPKRMPCESNHELACATQLAVVTGRESLNGTRLTCCAVDSQTVVLICSEGHSLIAVYNSGTDFLTPSPSSILSPSSTISPSSTPPPSTLATPPTLTAASPDPSPDATNQDVEISSGAMKSQLSKPRLLLAVLLTVLSLYHIGIS